MKCQIPFSRTNKINITNLSSVEAAHSVLSVKENCINYPKCSGRHAQANSVDQLFSGTRF